MPTMWGESGSALSTCLEHFQRGQLLKSKVNIVDIVKATLPDLRNACILESRLDRQMSRLTFWTAH